MLSTGLSLALLTTTGFIIVYQKMPRRVRRWLEKYSLFTDIVALLLTYALFGGTIVALFAAAFTGLFVSFLLHIASHEEDYLYLFDLRDWLKDQFAALKDGLSAYGETYRKTKETPDLHVVDGGVA